MYKEDKGGSYKGRVNTTVSGQECLYWDQVGFQRYRDFSISDKEYGFSFDGNSCRNPSANVNDEGRIVQFATVNGPACFIDQNKIEECAVPYCGK